MNDEQNFNTEQGIEIILPPVMRPTDFILKRQPEQIEVSPLPVSAQLPIEMSSGACPWLDEYVNFSRRWSPRGHDEYHTATGLWLLSTVAARRVYANLGRRRYTNLYISLAGRTSVHSKTTTARVGIDLLKAAGLKYLLTADESTPQKFVKDMTYTISEKWREMSEELQQYWLHKMAFAGQRGWYYDEFGQKVDSMMRQNGIMSDYRGLFRRFDENEDVYDYGTIGRGNDVIYSPYLALLANITPADLKPFAKRGGALWNDGFWARFAFVAPPENAERNRGRFPTEEKTHPLELLKPIVDWHNRLGYQMPTVIERQGELIPFEIKGQPQIENEIGYGSDVYEAFYAYDEAMLDIVSSHEANDLDGNYTRLPEKAFRIAILLASFSGSPKIEMRHWAKAQQISELWRANLHNLYAQVTSNSDSKTQDQVNLEDSVMDLLAKRGPSTKREMMQYISGKQDSETINRTVKSMVDAGVIIMQQNGRAEKYLFAPKDS